MTTMQDQAEQVVNMVLEDDVSLALCRRGKVKLRDIETTSRALLRLDSTKKGLEIRGSPACVADACRKIENLSGIKLEARPSVWAELMRTRTSSDTDSAAIANIQEKSGSRIHIKRDSTQIQIFGSKVTTHTAAQLIERLDSMCGEVAVSMKDTGFFSQEQLHSMAVEFGVTFVQDQAHINILGIKGAIAEASRNLLFWEENTELQPAHNGTQRRSEVAHTAIANAMADLKIAAPISIANNANASSSFTTSSGSDTTTEEGAKSFLTERSQDTDALDLSSGPCPSCGAFAFCAQCGKRAEKMDHIYNGTCPTCLIPKFCVHCGSEWFRTVPSGRPI